MGQKIKLNALNRSERASLIEAAEFTEEQKTIFDCMFADMYDVAIMQRMNISSSTYYRIKSITVDKIVRTAREIGLDGVIKAR